jgi:hypothetical protein
MYSGSKVFEKAYAEFVQHAIDQRILSVEKTETPQARIVTLAGVRRLRYDKRNGRLSCERLNGARTPASATWVADKQWPLAHFWASTRELLSAVNYAWQSRLEQFLPGADVCFPKLSKRDTEKYHNNQVKWNSLVSFAGERRLGGRARQNIVARGLASALWNFLVDRDTLRVCHAYFGRKATFDDYNFTVRRIKELSARAQETPNLTRLVGEYIRLNATLRTGKRVLPADILATARTELFSLARQRTWHAYHREVRPVVPAEPLTPAGWRLVTGQSGAAVDRLWQTALRTTHARVDRGESPGPVLAGVLNLMAKTGEQAPLSFLQWAVENLIEWSTADFSPDALGQVRESLLRFMRLAAQQSCLARRRGRLKRFLSGDMQLAWDWFRNQGRDAGVRFAGEEDAARPLVLTKHSTWASVMRSQHEWHATRAERERQRREANQQAHQAWQARQDARTWESALADCEVSGVQVLPLTTGRALREEGEQMAHCVGGYVDACARGGSRIFALAHGAARATVELVQAGKQGWKVRQVFGPRNSEAPKPLAEAARALAKRYAEAARVLGPELGSSAQ